MRRPALAWCPCPDTRTARELAHSLLDERLIVCANIVPAIQSIYEWNGERGESAEVGLLMKTNVGLLDQVCKRAGDLHPYDAPVVIGWDAEFANPAALDWIASLGPDVGESDG